MFRLGREVLRINQRTYKNFGHKREPEPRFTVVWHGFLTFSFIGLAIEWKRVLSFIFGDDPEISELTSPVHLDAIEEKTD